jgi:tRNA threonylcarbamoyladenosine biosynthesis protein TsaB
MTTRLALDASLGVPTCALTDGTTTFVAHADGRAVEQMPALIRQVLATVGKRLADIDELVAGVGPGSYMGVRSVVAAVNALALATGTPVTGVLSVDGLAVRAPMNDQVTVAVPAGRGRFFVAQYVRRDEMLMRVVAPHLEDTIESGTVLAASPAAEGLLHERLDGDAFLAVIEYCPHLVIESRCAQVTPHLPPPRLGAQ